MTFVSKKIVSISFSLGLAMLMLCPSFGTWAQQDTNQTSESQSDPLLERLLSLIHI